MAHFCPTMTGVSGEVAPRIRSSSDFPLGSLPFFLKSLMYLLMSKIVSSLSHLGPGFRWLDSNSVSPLSL